MKNVMIIQMNFDNILTYKQPYRIDSTKNSGFYLTDFVKEENRICWSLKNKMRLKKHNSYNFFDCVA